MFALDVRTERPSFPGCLHGGLRKRELAALGLVVGPQVVCPRLADRAGGHVGLDTIHGAPKQDAYCAVDADHSDAN